MRDPLPDAGEWVVGARNVKPAGVYPFIHGRQHRLPSGILLADSYHCSRYNTNTCRLTTAIFESVFEALTPMLRG